MIRLDSIVVRHFYSSDADNDMSSSLKRSDELCDLIMCCIMAPIWPPEWRKLTP